MAASSTVVSDVSNYLIGFTLGVATSVMAVYVGLILMTVVG